MAAGSGGQFVIARNPDPHSRLPYLLRVPVPGSPEMVFATQGTWPSGKDLYCHPVPTWPDHADVVAAVDVERCWRSGAAVHLVLKRRQARRSLFVWTEARGRTVIFWRSQTSVHKARPGVRIPHAQGLEKRLQVAVDTRERYPWRFARYEAELERRELPVGDYALLTGDTLMAALERKTVPDLAHSATQGTLSLTLAELSRMPHAALVVEGRLSDLVQQGNRGGVRPGWLLNVVAALQVTYPGVAWMFAETRALAEDYAYRWLAAAAHAERAGAGTEGVPREVPSPSGAGEALPTSTSEWPRELQPVAEVHDATARRSLVLREAWQGTVWTTASLAARCGISKPTAWHDLRALVAEGLLVAEGSRRDRRYRAP